MLSPGSAGDSRTVARTRVPGASADQRAITSPLALTRTIVALRSRSPRASTSSSRAALIHQAGRTPCRSPLRAVPSTVSSAVPTACCCASRVSGS